MPTLALTFIFIPELINSVSSKRVVWCSMNYTNMVETVVVIVVMSSVSFSFSTPLVTSLY